MLIQIQQAIAINFSITSATTLSGVDAPEVIPTLIFPLGKNLFLSSKSDPNLQLISSQEYLCEKKKYS